MSSRSIKTFRSAKTCVLTLGLLAGLSANTQAADYISGTAPVVTSSACHEQSVINRAVAQFTRMIHGMPDMPNVQIDAVSNVSTTHIEPKTYPSGFERTFCKATARLSNGDNRSIWYIVENGQGFASIGSNVESCVEGFDKWYVYDGNCRIAIWCINTI